VHACGNGEYRWIAVHNETFLWITSPQRMAVLANEFCVWHYERTTSDCRAIGETVAANTGRSEQSKPRKTDGLRRRTGLSNRRGRAQHQKLA